MYALWQKALSSDRCDFCAEFFSKARYKGEAFVSNILSAQVFPVVGNLEFG